MEDEVDIQISSLSVEETARLVRRVDVPGSSKLAGFIQDTPAKFSFPSFSYNCFGLVFVFCFIGSVAFVSEHVDNVFLWR